MTYPHGDEVHVVNAVFECQVLGGQIRPDGDETLEAAYFTPDALPMLRRTHQQHIADALSGQREVYFR